MDDRLRSAVAQNDAAIMSNSNSKKRLEKAQAQLDPNYRGFMLFLVQLATDAKRLPMNQRTRVLRSINNVMSSVKSLRSDLRSCIIDSGFQVNALKFRNDGLKRDLNRRKNASQSR